MDVVGRTAPIARRSIHQGLRPASALNEWPQTGPVEEAAEQLTAASRTVGHVTRLRVVMTTDMHAAIPARLRRLHVLVSPVPLGAVHRYEALHAVFHADRERMAGLRVVHFLPAPFTNSHALFPFTIPGAAGIACAAASVPRCTVGTTPPSRTRAGGQSHGRKPNRCQATTSLRSRTRRASVAASLDDDELPCGRGRSLALPSSSSAGRSPRTLSTGTEL